MSFPSKPPGVPFANDPDEPMLPATEEQALSETATREEGRSSLTDAPANPSPNVFPTPGVTEQSGAPGDLQRQKQVEEGRLRAVLRAARVKADCRIEDVIRQHGVALRGPGNGQRLVGVCPFHSERRGSFTVYPATQSFYCFGCCAVGDVITFIRLFHGASFAEALRLLGEGGARASISGSVDAQTLTRMPHTSRSGVGGERGDSAEQGEKNSVAPNDMPTATQDAQLVHLALLWTTSVIAIEGLPRAPEALTYLGERGISYELARACQLGYLPDDYLERALTGNAVLAPLARELGLLNRADRCALARRLVIPEVRQGMVTQLIGRVIPGNDTPLPEVKYYLLCGTPSRGLLGYGAAIARLERRLERMRAQTRVRTRTRTQRGVPQRASPTTATIVTGGWDSRSTRATDQPLRGILVLEGALDYVIAQGWDLPVLPVALLSAYPSRGQLAELLELQQRSGGLPLLLQLDDDAAGGRGTAFMARFLDEAGALWRRLPPLPRPPVSSPVYKDLGEAGLLGPEGRALMMASLDQVGAEWAPTHRPEPA